MKCTWVDCEEEATTPQLSENGEQWANLCDYHNLLMKDALDNLDVKVMVSRWVKAQGGAKAATDRLRRQQCTTL